MVKVVVDEMHADAVTGILRQYGRLNMEKRPPAEASTNKKNKRASAVVGIWCPFRYRLLVGARSPKVTRGQPPPGADAERRRSLIYELPRPEGDGSARGPCTGQRQITLLDAAGSQVAET